MKTPSSFPSARSLKTKLILPPLVLQPSSFPQLHAAEQIQRVPLSDVGNSSFLQPRARLWGLCFAESWPRLLWRLPSSSQALQSASFYNSRVILWESRYATVRCISPERSSQSPLHVFLTPYSSFFRVLRDFTSCGVKQSTEQARMRNFIKNYCQGSFPDTALPVAQAKGWPGRGNGWPKRQKDVCSSQR